MSDELIMSKVIIIGCGNPLRGDDGIGWYAVDRLAESHKQTDFEFIKCRELLPEISEKISEAKYVLFIDAAVDSGEQLSHDAVGEKNIAPAENFPSLDTHQLDPGGLLAFSAALYGNIPEAVMLTVKGKSFEYREGISDEVQQDVLSLISRAHEILNKWSEELQAESCSR